MSQQQNNKLMFIYTNNNYHYTIFQLCYKTSLTDNYIKYIIYVLSSGGGNNHYSTSQPSANTGLLIVPRFKTKNGYKIADSYNTVISNNNEITSLNNNLKNILTFQSRQHYTCVYHVLGHPHSVYVHSIM